MRVFDDGHFSVAYRRRAEIGRERIRRFDADAVHADRLLEHRVVILRAGVDVRHAVVEFAERNTAPVIADLHAPVADIDIDSLSEALRKFVDRIVDTFF